MTSSHRQALGRGLSSLIPKTAESSSPDSVDIDLIAPNPEQPRARFDPVALLERLAVLIPTSIELASAVALQAMEEHRSAGIEWAWVVTRGRSMSA